MKNLLVMIVLITLSACSDRKDNLSCSDSDATELVMDISTKELKDQLYKIYLIKEIGALPKFLVNWSFDEYKEMERSDVQEKVLEQTKETVDNLELSNIRLQKRDTTTGMISCAGTLSVKDRNLDIAYTAQINDNGDLFVEVSGL